MKRPSTDPTAIYRYRDGIYAVDLVTAAIVEFDFFTWLDSHPATLTEICRHFAFKERPVDVMLTLFLANSWVQKNEDVFSVTRLAKEHLVAGTPWCIEPYYSSLKDRPICQDFIKVLKTGQPANWSGTQGQGDWHDEMGKDDFAKYFTAAMDSRGVVLGGALAERLLEKTEIGLGKRVLDIGGGSGVYASALVDVFPDLTATVFEKPPVDQVTRQYLSQRGHGDRVSIKPGDMFKDAFPTGYDIHLFSNVLHDWNVKDVKHLLTNSAETMAAGGWLIVHEAFLNEDKSGPLPVAEYSTILMHSTQGRCYGTSEMRSFIEGAGFSRVDHFETIADRSVFVARR